MVVGPHNGDVAKYLQALLHPYGCSSLRHVKLQANFMAELQTLAQFTSLSSCIFRQKAHDKIDFLSLTPLSGLLHLSHLSLGGRDFTDLSAVSRVTHLEVNHAFV